MILTDKQARDISRLITDHHTAFLINIGLGEGISEAEVDRLRKAGLVQDSVMRRSLVDDAFLFGFLADALGEAEEKNLSFDEFQHFVQARDARLSSEEKAALRHVKKSFATHIKSLGARFEEATGVVLSEADKLMRLRLEQAVDKQIARGIERRKSLKEISTGLRKATKDVTRDWLRVAVTEVNNGFQEGKLSLIQKSSKGKDPYVFKNVRPDACDECRDAYLLPNGQPRVFRLSELLAHGSNIGKSKSQRRATVSSYHPWCQCELQELPEGFSLGNDGKMKYTGLR